MNAIKQYSRAANPSPPSKVSLDVFMPMHPVTLRVIEVIGRSRWEAPSDNVAVKAGAAFALSADVAVRLRDDERAGRTPIPRGGIRLGKNLSRFLIAFHRAVLKERLTTVVMDDHDIARAIWGKSSHKPANWRQSTIAAVQSAAQLSFRVGSEVVPFRNILNADFLGGRSYLLTIDPGFLFDFAAMVEDDVVHLAAKHPRRGSAPLQQEIIAVREEYFYMTGTDADIGFEVRERRKEATKKPSLQTLARKNQVVNVFLPAMLGERIQSDRFGLIAQKLSRELSRKYVVNHAKVPGRHVGESLTCPFLDPGITHVAFAANGKNRRQSLKRPDGNTGRGYKLATWASKLDVTVDQFLDLLEVAVPELGLVVTGLDQTHQWFDLKQIRMAPWDVRHRLTIRIYTPEGHISRWCSRFGWVPGAEAVERPRVGDLSRIGEAVRAKGIKKVASETGINPSCLSLYLRGKRKPSAETMRKLRGAVEETVKCCGQGEETLFGTAKTILDFAYAYREVGYSVIPIVNKKPCIKWQKYQTFRPTREEISHWWSTWPDAGIAVVLGPVSNLFAIDVDSAEAYNTLVGRLGFEPSAPKVFSGSGDPNRMHFFFRCPDVETSAKKCPWHPQLEFRGHRGLIVLPPSIHRSGNAYRWAEGASIEQIAPPEVPSVVVQALTERPASHAVERVKRSLVDLPTSLLGVPVNRLRSGTLNFLSGRTSNNKGSRNIELFKVACDLAENHVPYARAEEVSLAAMEIESDDHRRECRRTIRSGYTCVSSKQAKCAKP